MPPISQHTFSFSSQTQGASTRTPSLKMFISAAADRENDSKAKDKIRVFFMSDPGCFCGVRLFSCPAQGPYEWRPSADLFRSADLEKHFWAWEAVDQRPSAVGLFCQSISFFHLLRIYRFFYLIFRQDLQDCSGLFLIFLTSRTEVRKLNPPAAEIVMVALPPFLF